MTETDREPSALARAIVDALWGVFHRQGLVTSEQMREAGLLVDQRILLDAEERRLGLVREELERRDGRCE